MGENFKRKTSRGDFSKAAKKAKVTAVDETKSSSAQKRQLKKERQSHRRHADTVSGAKVLWNKLRLKTNTTEDTKELMVEVMDLIRGKVNEIALQHDASRVVQAAVQFGNEEQRKELLEEICEESAAGLAELAKIQYAHFCCLKFIKYCNRDEASVKKIVKAFKGSIPKLAVHSVGSRVLESLFLNLPTKTTASLKQELYGPHFSLFASNVVSTPTLKSVLESAKTDTQKESATSFVKEIVAKGINKGFFGFTYFQELFAEYIDVAEPNDIRAIASSVADHAIHLLSTRSGSRIVAACATYGTPKDRKRICKSLKGYTGSSLLHRDAYLALLRLVEVTDDTVSINKSILNELLAAPKNEEGESSSPLLGIATSDSASKLFLMLLVADDEARMKYFDPYERSIIGKKAFVKENGQEVPTSKKDPKVRREELLKYLESPLTEACSNHAAELLVSLPGSRVLKELYNATHSDDIVAAVVDACASGLDNDEGKGNIFEDSVGHRTIKNLILSDADHEEQTFTEAFFNKFEDQLMDVASSNRGAFVVASLYEVSSTKTAVSNKIKSQEKKLKELSKADGPTAGFEALLKLVNQ